MQMGAAPFELAQLHATMAQLRAGLGAVQCVETLGVRCGSVMPLGARACCLVFNHTVMTRGHILKRWPGQFRLMLLREVRVAPTGAY